MVSWNKMIDKLKIEINKMDLEEKIDTLNRIAKDG